MIEFIILFFIFVFSGSTVYFLSKNIEKESKDKNRYVLTQKSEQKTKQSVDSSTSKNNILTSGYAYFLKEKPFSFYFKDYEDFLPLILYKLKNNETIFKLKEEEEQKEERTPPLPRPQHFFYSPLYRKEEYGPEYGQNIKYFSLHPLKVDPAPNSIKYESSIRYYDPIKGKRPKFICLKPSASFTTLTLGKKEEEVFFLQSDCKIISDQREEIITEISLAPPVYDTIKHSKEEKSVNIPLILPVCETMNYEKEEKSVNIPLILPVCETINYEKEDWVAKIIETTEAIKEDIFSNPKSRNLFLGQDIEDMSHFFSLGKNIYENPTPPFFNSQEREQKKKPLYSLYKKESEKSGNNESFGAINPYYSVIKKLGEIDTSMIIPTAVNPYHSILSNFGDLDTSMILLKKENAHQERIDQSFSKDDETFYVDDPLTPINLFPLQRRKHYSSKSLQRPRKFSNFNMQQNFEEISSLSGKSSVKRKISDNAIYALVRKISGKEQAFDRSVISEELKEDDSLSESSLVIDVAKLPLRKHSNEKETPYWRRENSEESIEDSIASFSPKNHKNTLSLLNKTPTKKSIILSDSEDNTIISFIYHENSSPPKRFNEVTIQKSHYYDNSKLICEEKSNHVIGRNSLLSSPFQIVNPFEKRSIFSLKDIHLTHSSLLEEGESEFGGSLQSSKLISEDEEKDLTLRTPSGHISKLTDRTLS